MNYPIPDGPPQIATTVDTDEPGYSARALCTVDGLAAEVRLRVHTKYQERSHYRIDVFDGDHMTWFTVYALKYEDVGRMPVLGNDPSALIELNAVAERLWSTANAIVAHSRSRGDQLELAQAGARVDISEKVRAHYARRTSLAAHMRTIDPSSELTAPSTEETTTT